MTYHPYLNAEVQASDMIDGLRASSAQLAASDPNRASRRLFVTGYSQGGHVAMATHRALERDHADEFGVTAAAPISRPYNLASLGDTVTAPSGAVNLGGTIFTPYLLTSYQNSYGDIYATASDAYQAPFDKTSRTLFPTDTPVTTLMAEGLLPNDPTFTRRFGTGGLLTDSFCAACLSSNFRKALQKNTLLEWTPKAPVALCGGGDDPTVFFSNGVDMQNDCASRGVVVPLWNLEQRASLPTGRSYSEVFDAFSSPKPRRPQMRRRAIARSWCCRLAIRSCAASSLRHRPETDGHFSRSVVHRLARSQAKRTALSTQHL